MIYPTSMTQTLPLPRRSSGDSGGLSGGRERLANNIRSSRGVVPTPTTMGGWSRPWTKGASRASPLHWPTPAAGTRRRRLRNRRGDGPIRPPRCRFRTRRRTRRSPSTTPHACRRQSRSASATNCCKSFVADASGRRRRQRIPLPAAALGNRDRTEIQITVDRTFVPANLIAGSRDVRELGIKVYHAAVERDPVPTPGP